MANKINEKSNVNVFAENIYVLVPFHSWWANKKAASSG